MAYFTKAGSAAAVLAATALALPAFAVGDPGKNNAGGQGNGNGTPHAAPAPASAPQRTASTPAHQPSRPATHQAAPSHSATPHRTHSAPTHSSGPQSGPDTGSGQPGSLNTDCTTHKDPRDPGSCQEKGRGNSFDRDPYRGPNRGNDCDEGGGNNVNGSRTNTHNADSPDDNDRGQGNNRCATSSTQTTPGSEQHPTGGPTQIASSTPAGAQTVAGVRETVPSSPSAANQRTLPVSDTSPGTASGSPAATTATGRRELPFTGFDVAWLALFGLTLCGLSLVVRRVARRHGA
jgi:hypothetical protein